MDGDAQRRAGLALPAGQARFATDPAFRQQLTNKKMAHELNSSSPAHTSNDHHQRLHRKYMTRLAERGCQPMTADDLSL